MGDSSPIGRFIRWALPGVLAGVLSMPGRAETAHPSALYISPAGHNFRADAMPLQTAETVKASLEIAAKLGIRRVYWRGFQETYLLAHARFRKENFLIGSYWDWLRELDEKRGIHQAALRASGSLGIEIWGVWGLFDLGSDPREDAYCGAAAGMGPMVFEDTIRIDHPEAVPKDRQGIRTQCGSIRFQDPEIRRTLISRLVAIMDKGYDGLLLYTYAETLSLWFSGEFDRGAEGPLSSGEVTAFVRELRAGLLAKNKRLALQIDPRPVFRDTASPWLGLTPDVNTVGQVVIAWKDWLREGLLDEIVVAVPEGSQEDAARLAEEIMRDFPGTPVVLLSRRGKVPSSRAMIAVDARSPDFRARFLERALTADPLRLWAQTTSAPLISPGLLKSADSAAVVAAIGSLKDKPMIPWAPELLRIIRSHPGFPVRQQAAETLGSWGVAAAEMFDSLAADTDASVRRVAFQAAATLPVENRSRWLAPALRDADPYNRWIAVRGLSVTPRSSDSARVISGILQQDPDPTVRSAAAWMVRPGMEVGPGLFAALKERFIALHQEPAWRWEFRTVGAALLRSGPDGLEFLQACLSRTKPPGIADSAWRVIYVPQDGAALNLVDSSQAAEACRAYPRTPPAPQHPGHQPPPK